MKLWVKRSDYRPLSFVLRFEREAGNDRDRAAARVLVKAVAELSERWVFLSVRCHALLMFMLPFLVFKHSPKLQRVDLTQTGPRLRRLIWFLPEPVPTLPSASSNALTKFKVQGGLALKMQDVYHIGTNLTCFIYHH